MALYVVYCFASAQAAIFIAVKTKACIHGWLACAFVRLRSAKPFFRDLFMTLDRFCRDSLSLAFCVENVALALRASPSCRIPMRRGGRRAALDSRKL